MNQNITHRRGSSNKLFDRSGTEVVHPIEEPAPRTEGLDDAHEIVLKDEGFRKLYQEAMLCKVPVTYSLNIWKSVM